VTSRPSWDSYLIGLAHHVATRSTCPRLAVGAVLVDRHHRIVSTGYNGAPPGEPHCTDQRCQIGTSGGCERTIHAERNAIDHAPSGLHDLTLYVTDAPCGRCAMAVVGWRLWPTDLTVITSVVYDRPYRNTTGLALLATQGINTRSHSMDTTCGTPAPGTKREPGA
jgi:dCMP deaminase